SALARDPRALQHGGDLPGAGACADAIPAAAAGAAAAASARRDAARRGPRELLAGTHAARTVRSRCPVADRDDSARRVAKAVDARPWRTSSLDRRGAEYGVATWRTCDSRGKHRAARASAVPAAGDSAGHRVPRADR